jgi:hypothetical protein
LFLYTNTKDRNIFLFYFCIFKQMHLNHGGQAEFAKAVPYPIANSVSYEIYRNMPNDTDLTPFKKNGNMGLNFAFINNKFDYHTLPRLTLI